MAGRIGLLVHGILVRLLATFLAVTSLLAMLGAARAASLAGGLAHSAHSAVGRALAQADPRESAFDASADEDDLDDDDGDDDPQYDAALPDRDLALLRPPARRNELLATEPSAHDDPPRAAEPRPPRIAA
jgi:hypothetical protein